MSGFVGLDGYDQLSNAVVVKAAEDYREALVKKKMWDDRVEELERFFDGEHIKIYTNLDGPSLARKLKEQVIEYQYNLKALYKDQQYSSLKKIKEEES